MEKSKLLLHHSFLVGRKVQNLIKYRDLVPIGGFVQKISYLSCCHLIFDKKISLTTFTGYYALYNIYIYHYFLVSRKVQNFINYGNLVPIGGHVQKISYLSCFHLIFDKKISFEYI